MSERPPTPDQAARDAIAARLDDTLFVEAGAGSGKTSALVGRVVALVTTGTAELREIAAITFTEKAGAELRDRVRTELRRREATDGDPAVVARCKTALDQLDGAALGTLHGFAQRLLSENPIEARLPPRIEVLDEVSSGVEFARRWSAYREQLLADPGLARTLLLLFAVDVPAKALDALAVDFEANWDLVAERVQADVPEPPSLVDELRPLVTEIDALVRRSSECCRDDDKLLANLATIADWSATLVGVDDELELLHALGPGGRPRFSPTYGRKENWDDVNSVRKDMHALVERLDALTGTVTRACAHRLGAAIRAFTLAAAEERRAAGQLAFHDLLVLGRQLLRDPKRGPEVRRRLHQRYPRLLLDEFQDTDPIQIELAVRIAATDPGDPAAGSAPWPDVPVAPGHLFVVGDPMQSIYRFRRADIGTFLRAKQRFAVGEGAVRLTTNFRSTGPVIDWVNHVFGTLADELPQVELGEPSRPDYSRVEAVREAAPEGPSVSVLGREPLDDDPAADALRRDEASDVAATVARIHREGWSVSDGNGGWRPARLGDITILIPARTSLSFLQDALDDLGVPHRAEASSLVYATRAVRDVLMVLRAVDDPTNHLHILSALRTPLLACGDDDLFRFRVERRGRWSYLAEQPETVPPDDPVRAGLDYLRELHTRRHWHAPSELLDRITRDRRAFELGFAEGRSRDVWRRLRFVIDQARAWSEATGGSLREYLHWVGQQSAEGVRVAEAILPETDDDAVRIMTIHAAKGLEFPITIVSGMSTRPSGRAAAAEARFLPSGEVAYKLGRGVTTDEWDEYKPIDEQMGFDERIRLLYVACTRAQDHLVVSLYRKARAGEGKPNARTNAELLVAGMGALLDDLPDAVEAAGNPVPVPRPEPPAPLPPFAEWEAERDAALARGRRPTAVAATALTDEGGHDPEEEATAGLQKRPRDLDLPPWLKGRYGTAVGRAVHGTLQTIDLATGEGLDAAVAAQCEAEAIPNRAGDVRTLVRAALTSQSVQEAAAAPHWREVYACAPVEGRLLEGYVDLLYRGVLGLVVVDHKTASTDDRAELDRRLQGYRLQGASYALTVSATTGEPVDRVTFLFLTPKGPVELHLDDLDGAIEEVRALVAAGAEILVEEPDLAS